MDNINVGQPLDYYIYYTSNSREQKKYLFLSPQGPYDEAGMIEWLQVNEIYNLANYNLGNYNLGNWELGLLIAKTNYCCTNSRIYKEGMCQALK